MEENICEFRGFWAIRECFLVTIFCLLIIFSHDEQRAQYRHYLTFQTCRLPDCEGSLCEALLCSLWQ